LSGLIVWKKFNKQLTQEECRIEEVNLQNEGFTVLKIKNSNTIILAVSSEGLAFSKARLRNTGVSWQRCVETHVLLNNKAMRKLEELENE